MEKTQIIFNKKGNTLDIWFADPKKEFVSEETSDEIILKKDRKGKVIGIEILNFIQSKIKPRQLPIQLMVG
ncbi:MAG: DUF2283 domain-containing protein [Candidatus Micrarchaeales archaeon]